MVGPVELARISRLSIQWAANAPPVLAPKSHAPPLMGEYWIGTWLKTTTLLKLTLTVLSAKSSICTSTKFVGVGLTEAGGAVWRLTRPPALFVRTGPAG